MDIKLKAEAEKKKMGFGKFGGELGKATPAQLEELALIAVKSQDPSLLELFEGDLPSAQDLQKKKTTAQIAKVDENEGK